MTQITVSAGSSANVTLPANNRLVIGGSGIYRVGPLGTSQRPTVDQLIDTTSTVGPFEDSCIVSIRANGGGAVYELIAPTDALDSRGLPALVSGGWAAQDAMNAARAAIPPGTSRGSAPARRFKASVDLIAGAPGVSVNAVATAVDAAKWGRETDSLRVTPSANVNAYITKAFAGAPQDWSAVTEFGFTIYSDRDLPANATVTVNFSNDQTWINTRGFTFPLNAVGTRDGRQYIKVRLDQAATNFGPYAGTGTDGTGWSTGGTGAAFSSNIQWMRIDLTNLSGIPIWIEGVYTGGATRPAVVLYFDNWWDGNPGAQKVRHSQYIKPILDQYGWKCGITVPLDAIDNGGPTSLAEMDRMHTEGHDIICNDVTDAGLITQGISADQVREQVRRTRRTLAGYGLTRGNSIWCLNQNESNQAIRQVMRDEGIVYARGGVTERRWQHWEMGIESFVGGSSGLDGMSSAKVKALWQRAIDYKGVAEVYWHTFAAGGVIDGARPAQSLTSWVEEFADYMADLRTKEQAGLIDVLSPTQAQVRRETFGNLYQA